MFLMSTEFKVLWPNEGFSNFRPGNAQTRKYSLVYLYLVSSFSYRWWNSHYETEHLVRPRGASTDTAQNTGWHWLLMKAQWWGAPPGASWVRVVCPWAPSAWEVLACQVVLEKYLWKNENIKCWFSWCPGLMNTTFDILLAWTLQSQVRQGSQIWINMLLKSWNLQI